MRTKTPEPRRRSEVRLRLGKTYYTARRRVQWLFWKKTFAKERAQAPFDHLYFAHKTPLMRKLKDVEMWMQENKVKNLRLACEKLNGIVLRPGEVFSYWYLIGKPTRRKGYVDGMVLKSGTFTSGLGGGMCQLSNLIFWMTLHTPLTVVERHRHSYDVFPDAGRTQPFGSGATCFYPYGDLMIRNDTEETFCLSVRVGEEFLEGAWSADRPPLYRYEVEERNHTITSEYWGGYVRHNELYRRQFDLAGNLLDEQLCVENNAIMMYSPLLGETQETQKR